MVTAPVALSSCRVADGGVVRDSTRPAGLRDARYALQFDWTTLFYDVYRVGEHIVFQGPPLRNFAPLLKQSSYFAPKFRRLWPHAELIERNHASEIWVRDPSESIVIDGALGHHAIEVQPDLSPIFAGRRVVTTLSKDNDIDWIVDWIRFYVRIHGADAVLLYDNGSNAYETSELRARLDEAFPDLAIVVVDWPFPYGPQGGAAGAVDGVEAPWDSDFCQTGSLQHARHRFLRTAKSVLNVDIDELVLSTRGRSIFAATESSWSGFVKFSGVWIGTATPHVVNPGARRHGDFWLRDRAEDEACPPKWCIRPAAADRRKHGWSVHNLFGARANRRVTSEFTYRHIRGISNGWKYDRWDDAPFDATRFEEDGVLKAALERAGLVAAA